jgi:hypothetical protein
MIQSLNCLCLAGYLAVVTIPPDARVEVNGRLVGRTPLVTEVVPGSAHVSVVREWGGSFFKAETTTIITVADNDTSWLALQWAAPLYVDSNPQGATVAVEGDSAGLTPTVLRGLAPGTRHLTISHPCCPDSALAVSLSPLHPQRIAVRLEPGPGQSQRSGPRLLVPAAGVLLSLASGLTAWALHEEADRAYEDYLSAADLKRIEDRYEKAQRLDRAAAGLWALSLSSFLGTLLWWAVPG